MMKKNFFITLVLSFVMLLSAIPAYGASANPIKLTDKEISKLKMKMNSEGVQNDKQVLLIKKIKNGELIDSMNPEKLKAIPEDYFSLSNIDSEKKYVFPDGSYFKMSTIDIINENEQKLLDAIGDKKVVDKLIKNKDENQEQIVQTSGFYNYNKWIQHDLLLSGGGFQCDFTTASDINTGRSVINSISDELSWAIGGYTTQEKLSMVRQAQIGTTPAEAKLTWKYILYNGSASSYYGFSFSLKYESWWTTTL